MTKHNIMFNNATVFVVQMQDDSINFYIGDDNRVYQGSSITTDPGTLSEYRESTWPSGLTITFDDDGFYLALSLLSSRITVFLSHVTLNE